MNKQKLGINGVAAFLIFECLALTSFALGGIDVIFYCFGFIVGALGLIYFFDKIDKRENKSLLIIILGLVLLSGLTIFSKFYNGSGNIATQLIIFLAIPSFFLVGIVARRLKIIKPKHILICVGTSIAILVLLSSLYTLVQYGPFYVVRFKNTPIYYYNGNLFDITKECGWLIGFKFTEVTIEYAGVFSMILASSLSALFFINPKEDKRTFIITLVIGSIGLISLILTPNIIGLLLLIPVAIFACYWRFARKYKEVNKVVNIVILALLAIGLILFLIAFLNASGAVSGLSNAIAGNKLLNRLFNTNRIIKQVNTVIAAVSKTSNLFGVASNDAAILATPIFFEIETLKTSGIFAFIVLLGFMVISAISLFRYSKHSKDSDGVKIVLLTGLFAFILYQSCNYSAFNIIHDSSTYNSFLFNPLTLVMLAMLGYAFYPKKLDYNEEYLFEKIDVPVEVKETKDDVEISTDEYNFD